MTQFSGPFRHEFEGRRELLWQRNKGRPYRRDDAAAVSAIASGSQHNTIKAMRCASSGARSQRARSGDGVSAPAWRRAICFGVWDQERFLNRQLVLPVSMMSQWCVSRSSMAVVIL